MQCCRKNTEGPMYSIQHPIYRVYSVLQVWSQSRNVFSAIYDRFINSSNSTEGQYALIKSCLDIKSAQSHQSDENQTEKVSIKYSFMKYYICFYQYEIPYICAKFAFGLSHLLVVTATENNMIDGFSICIL